MIFCRNGGGRAMGVVGDAALGVPHRLFTKKGSGFACPFLLTLTGKK
jgi:hypothetical protein